MPRALRANDASIVRDFEAGFEKIAIPALLVQVVTGIWLALHGAPDVGAWFAAATRHANFVLGKLACLAATAALAAHARLRIIPRLTPALPSSWASPGENDADFEQLCDFVRECRSERADAVRGDAPSLPRQLHHRSGPLRAWNPAPRIPMRFRCGAESAIS